LSYHTIGDGIWEGEDASKQGEATH
jgi:hypothetical protein